VKEIELCFEMMPISLTETFMNSKNILNALATILSLIALRMNKILNTKYCNFVFGEPYLYICRLKYKYRTKPEFARAKSHYSHLAEFLPSAFLMSKMFKLEQEQHTQTIIRQTYSQIKNELIYITLVQSVTK
jgi:hypothetical protein